jgi:excisionase family DNA binding protein
MTDRTSNLRRARRASSASSRSRADARSRPVGQLRTIHQRAKLWEVSPRTVKRLIKSGALRAYRIGRLVRISDDDADAFLAENRDQ